MLTARFSVRPAEFALESALAAAPDVTLEADRTAAHSTSFVMPCFWATDGDLDVFEEALAADPTVEEVVTSESFDGERFYHVQWTDEVNEHVDTIIDHEGAILDARVLGRDWLLQIRFASRDQFETFRERVAEESGAYDLLDISATAGPHQKEGGPTAAQRDALVAAVDSGYYDIPRAATVEDVAADLDVSDQAVSERLRRGVKNLVTSVLVTGE